MEKYKINMIFTSAQSQGILLFGIDEWMRFISKYKSSIASVFIKQNIGKGKNLITIHKQCFFLLCFFKKLSIETMALLDLLFPIYHKHETCHLIEIILKTSFLVITLKFSFTVIL